MGKNNSGVGVGGSMTHFAGYVPRLHPSDFEVRHPRRRRRRLADLLRGAQALVRARRTRAAGGRPGLAVGRPPHLPARPPPDLRRRRVAWRGAEDCGIEMRVGPVVDHQRTLRQPARIASTAASACRAARSTPRPARSSPTCPTRSSTASRSAPTRWRSASRPTRAADGPPASPTSATARRTSSRADAVAVCGYAIETPRLLLHSTSRRFPNGLGNDNDQVGRYVMVQGATQVAGRFPEDLRMYKAPPPEVSSEQFYETDRVARLRPRVLHPDRLAAAHRLGRARAGRRPLGPGAARLHARLQPLERPRRALRAAPPGRQPRHARRRDRRVRNAGGEVHALACATTTAPTSPTPPRRCSASGSTPAPRTSSPSTASPTSSAARAWASPPEDSVVDSSHRVWGVDNLFVVDGSVLPTQGAANPALVIMALADRCARLLAEKRVAR